MKTTIFKNTLIHSFLLALALLPVGCQRDIASLQSASYSTNADVFHDTFSSGLMYAAFGGSYPQAFQVDNKVFYAGNASMRFEVPDFNSALGAYAGGSFFTNVARNLSSYNALTFYIKASQAASIDVIGFGNDLGANRYQTSINGLSVNSNWKKVIIPIPDPSKLTIEKGMFFYSEGPENGHGYTFWIDEVKFENISTIGHASASIFSGANKTVTSFVGVTNQVDGLLSTFNLPDGTNLSVNASPNYFTFKSSNNAVATVNETGLVTTVGSGTAVITATLGSTSASGSLTINSSGPFISAPTPVIDASKVISIFSDKYNNVPVDYYNGYWQPYQTTQSADFVVGNDHVLNYSNFNFVGIQFSSPTVDASLMSTLHLDIFVPTALSPGATFSVEVVDFGADASAGGTDDSSGKITYAAPTLQGLNWVSLNIPLKNLTLLKNKNHLGQIILSGTNIPNFYSDNIFFYNDGSIINATPTAAAPVPTRAAASVLSIFSDSYNNVPGTDFNPNWGQSTAVSQVPIAGNNTLKYAGLNYQGTQFANALNVSTYGFLHIDYYSANSSLLNFYLISPGPVEKAYSLSVPSGVGTNVNGWKSIDIPLSAFANVNLNNIIQFKVDGNGDIFFDNIYFHN